MMNQERQTALIMLIKEMKAKQEETRKGEEIKG